MRTYSSREARGIRVRSCNKGTGRQSRYVRGGNKARKKDFETSTNRCTFEVLYVIFQKCAI
jgi:hypothetical protein